MVWLLFNWVARTGNDPREYVQALKREQRQQLAGGLNLANALGTGAARGRATQNAALARELATMLDTEIDAGSMNEQSIMLRFYLCRALGEFETPEGLPRWSRRPTPSGAKRRPRSVWRHCKPSPCWPTTCPGSNRPVARHAGGRAGAAQSLARHRSRIRKTAAVPMGVVGGEKLTARLAAMLADGNPDVRYNAALRLAAQGDARALPVLAEMLDPEESAGVDLEKTEGMQPYKRVLIVDNALRAVEKAAGQEPRRRFDAGAQPTRADPGLESRQSATGPSS